MEACFHPVFIPNALHTVSALRSALLLRTYVHPTGVKTPLLRTFLRPKAPTLALNVAYCGLSLCFLHQQLGG